MSRSSLNPLQKHLITTLKADAASWATSASVYDEVPENSAFPYVEVEGAVEALERTKTQEWAETTVVFSVHSQRRGYIEANAIVDQVVQSLTAAAVLAAIDSNFKVVEAQYERTDEFKIVDQQGDTYRQANVRLLFRVEDLLT